MATLTLSTGLVKSGNIKFTYQYPDDSLLFQFQVIATFLSVHLWQEFERIFSPHIGEQIGRASCRERV